MERTILIAEDSPTQAERLRLLLEAHGYTVEHVPNGREGLRRVKLGSPDLIISDVVMPDMDGYAFCHAVKSAERTRRIPFVLLTERKTALDIIKGLERGADNFITKPFEDEYLLERVRRIFEQLEHRRRGGFEVEVTLRVGPREIVISADKQQIVELLFSTFEELCRLNDELAASKRTAEDYARNLEQMVEERTRKLRESEEQYRLLFDRNPHPMWVADYATIRFLAVNEAAIRHYGYSREEFLSMTLAAIRPPEEVPALHEHLRRLAAAPRAPVEQVGLRRHRKKDGALIDVEITRSPITFQGREARLVMAVDVTERKRMEVELERQRQVLYQTEKLSAMGQLLAGVAHELNNPLTIIAGHASILRQTAPPEIVERAEKISEASKRSTRIVRNFLSLARQRTPEREPTALNQVAREAVELLTYQLRVDDVGVAFDLAEDLPLLWADAHQLHQVMVNLVGNAHHALRTAPRPRRITIRTHYDAIDGKVSFVVADNGPGIAPEIATQIFEPFFTTKPPGEGTGLGLSLCRGIVEGHGGAIHVETAPDEGASFVVTLPVHARPSVGSTEVPTETKRGPERMTILVVDDEAEIAELLTDILTRDGHRVDSAINGISALEKLRTRSYDVILSDIKMPEMDGPALYRELERRHPSLTRRFVFISGDILSGDTAKFLEQAGLPTLQKPFVAAEVRAIVRRVLAT